MSTQVQTLKGFRDFLPEQMIIRQKVINTLKEVFESYGFLPIETPSVEYASTLLKKYGDEADKLVYTFEDKGKREVGLIYDLTVPTAKVLALYQNNISLPFKRYQIQRVWRADNTQKGRYREITMCDFDIFGVSSPMADAEIIAVINAALLRLKINNFTIKINSRKILFTILEKLGINDEEQKFSVLQSIDKLDKKTKEEVEQELLEKNISKEKIAELFQMLDAAKPEDDPDLLRVFQNAQELGVKQRSSDQAGYTFVPYLVRGLNYYTGTIFETVVDEPKIGSVTGGGRYDHLVSMLGGPDIPAVGSTLGLDRIIDVVEELNLLSTTSTITKALVTVFEGYEQQSKATAKELRMNGINTELYLKNDALDKQLKYANKLKIPYAIIIGADEAASNTVKLKNMKTGEQQALSLSELVKKLT
jgi:histidyl-tRNA synthetase